MNNKKVKDLTLLTLWKHKMDEKVQILGGVIIAYADSFLDDEP